LKDNVIEKENYFFDILSANNLSSFCYSSSMKYRIEEYLDSRQIKSEEMMKEPSFRRRLALQLSGYHNIKPDEYITPKLLNNGKKEKV
jgi:hypothetical protein